MDLKGHTTINANISTGGQTTMVDVNGVVAITGGLAPVPALIGGAAKLDVSASLQGEQISLERAELTPRSCALPPMARTSVAPLI